MRHMSHDKAVDKYQLKTLGLHCIDVTTLEDFQDFLDQSVKYKPKILHEMTVHFWQHK